MKLPLSTRLRSSLTRLPAWCIQNAYTIYLTFVGVTGMVLLLWGVTHLPTGEPFVNFLWLIALAVISAAATTSVVVSDDAGITYTIGPAISMAAVPFFGPGAAVVINVVHTFSMWVIKPADRRTWKKSGTQLAFNTGMHSIAMAVAGWMLLNLQQWLGPDTHIGLILPWLAAAYIYEEINFWLLVGVLRLQQGDAIRPVQMWKDDYWATQIGTLVTAFGSGILAFAVARYDWLGIVIFFLPSVLSAYAFRLYVRQMQTHLNNLEQIVTDRTKELAERTDELAEINRQKDAFLAVLTHDMITPLTSIQMYAELIQADPNMVVQNPELMQIMLRSQQTVLDLVTNILDIEKLESGGSLSTQKTSCDLTQLAADAVEIVHPEATEKQVSLVYRAAATDITVQADRRQMQRVLLNLMSNAIKYTPSGGEVRVEVGLQNGYAQINCCDTGYGIPPEDLPYIFDRYRRVGQLKDKAAGTGLGLAIAKALIAEHNGEIKVASEVGTGTTFTVKLPI